MAHDLLGTGIVAHNMKKRKVIKVTDISKGNIEEVLAPYDKEYSC